MPHKIYFSIIFLLIFKSGFCQEDLSYSAAPGYSPLQVITLKYNGKTYSEYEKDNITGSPFLFDEWRDGAIVLTNGKLYANIKLKFDVLNNKFLFYKNDSVYEFLDVLQKVILIDSASPNKDYIIFEKINNTTDKIKAGTFVQVLSTGKIFLFKQISKKITGENFSNGINTTTRRIVEYSGSWATVSNQTFPIKLNEKYLDDLTSDKKEELKKYIQQNQLKINKEKDFIAAVNYYNQITAKYSCITENI